MYILRDSTNGYYTERLYFKKKENAEKKLREIIIGFYIEHSDLLEEFENKEEFYGYVDECVSLWECTDVAELDEIQWEDEGEE